LDEQNRNFTLAPSVERKGQASRPPPPTTSKKRKARPTTTAPEARPSRSRRQATDASQDDDDCIEISSDDEEEAVSGSIVKIEDEEADPFTNLDPDADEEIKPKPVLSLSYQNFELPGRCLCVIVEPWPAIRVANRASRAPSVAAALRGSSIAPPEFVTSEQLAARGRTPLFLPDDEEDEIGQPQLNISQFPQRKILPPVPAFDADSTEDDENAELMQFSQTLNTGGMHRQIDDDDFEGAVFFADADEAREL
jgi:hypothetical protein